MTVQELIEQLQNFPKDMPVLVDGPQGVGCNDVSEIQKVAVELDYHTEWYLGAHEPSDEPDVVALCLSGTNHNAS